MNEINLKSILFIGGFFPADIRNEIIQNSISNTHNAADALQKGFLCGLKYFYPDMFIINAPFVGSFPKRYRKIYIPQCELDKGLSLGFFNLTGAKHFIISHKLRAQVKRWYDNSLGRKIIIIYSIQYPYLKAITDIKKSNPDIEIFLIVPDLVQFMGGPKGFIYRLSRKYEINKLEKCYQQVNSYVFLSKYMVEALPIEKRTWCVIEGIYSEEKEITHTSLPDSKQILYTGTLARRYGIMNLLDAFNKIKNIDAKLIICGSGDCESEIMEAAKSNSNIIFKGLIDRKKVLQLQEEATLLVNPRTPEGEFTSYSFPSKTIEYLASGIPTLLYKLPGIPDEYYDYCFSIENNNTVEFLTKEIERILSLDVNYLRDFGEKARNFILNEKNPLKQCEKFFRLIENN